MMIRYKNRHSIWLKTIILSVVCLFSLNAHLWSLSRICSPSRTALASQSIFNLSYAKRINIEIGLIIEMILKGFAGEPAYRSRININTKIDELYKEDKRFRKLLELTSNPRKTGDIIEFHLRTIRPFYKKQEFKIILKESHLEGVFDKQNCQIEKIKSLEKMYTDEDLWLIEYINKKNYELPSGEKTDLIRDSWKKAIADPRNPVIASILRLEKEGGISRRILKRLVDVLFGLSADVSEKLTASYHVSDIIKYMSRELLGENLSEFKRLIRDTDFNDIIPGPPLAVMETPDTDHKETLSELRKQYHALRKNHEEFIRSRNNFYFIYEEVSRTANAFLKKAIEALLPIVWKELGVPLDSDAVVYFREMKSFSSDVDAFYWGPKRLEVNIRISELLSMIGLKRDFFAAYLITEEVENKRIDFDIYHHFFNGEILEINNGSFKKFFAEHIEANANRDIMWQNVYPYLCRQLAVWNRTNPSLLPTDTRNFKKMLYRTATNIILGLCRKFDLPFGPRELGTLARLQKHLQPEEMRAILDTLALSSQERNLYQVITQRRWEDDVTDRVMSRIETIIACQGIADLNKKIQELGKKLEKIRGKYFGNPDFTETIYLPLFADERSRKGWQATAEIFKEIVKKNTNKRRKEFEREILENISLTGHLNVINIASEYLKDYPIDTIINSSLFPEEDLEANMKTWAYIIALNNTYGLDVNYIFESKNASYNHKTESMLLKQIEAISLLKQSDKDKIKARITNSRRPEAIKIHIMEVENLKKMHTIRQDTLPIAMSEGNTIDGIPLRDFVAANSIGLAQAACRKAQIEDSKKSNKEAPALTQVIKNVFPKLRSIYKRLLPKEIITEQTLLNMIHENPIVRKNVAISLALLPIIRLTINKLRNYHDRIQRLLRAA
ncbi:MAG: hypothetical protein JSV93_01550 [Candidatus Omnitrophota bacterium]|nr:MAG: hypothetical protein JSV93_01550 [Candidatus Omnitrophota bacterium]